MSLRAAALLCILLWAFGVAGRSYADRHTNPAGPTVSDLLTVLLADADPRFRVEAAFAAVRLAPGSDIVSRALELAAQGSSPWVSSWARVALREHLRGDHVFRFYLNRGVEERVGEVPPSLGSAICSAPEEYLGSLVTFLTQGIHDQALVVKTLHDWIAENIAYDVETLGSDDLLPSTYQDALMRGRTVCTGYARLMQRMCELAGLESVVISGFSRGYGFDPGRDSRWRANHAWNAVRIRGQWRLVDVTMDAGFIDADRSYRRSYRTSYLFALPHRFIHTHVPAEEKWQLLEDSLPREEAMELPWLDPEFGDNGFDLLAPRHLITTVEGTARIRIAHRAEWRWVGVSATLRGDSGAPARGRTFVQRRAGVSEVYVCLPGPGLWEVDISARVADSAQHVARLYFRSTGGVDARFDATGSSTVIRDRDGEITAVRLRDESGEVTDPGRIEAVLATLFDDTLTEAHWAYRRLETD